ncbi:MAG: TIGR02147 family protein [Proteobacteria bacterium]|nr:MAG: TIGR02147 family protein [Pseudomonadota bacterium]
MTPMIYGYQEPRLFLHDVLAQKQRANPLFSLRAWARQMGFRCHSSLVLLMSGKRKIRLEHCEKLNRALKLQGDQEKYLRLLVQMHASDSPREKEECATRLELLKPSAEETMLEAERFKLVADWIHMAILEMTKLKDFREDPSWIAARLGFGVREADVSDALQRLLSLELLTREEGRLVKTKNRLTTPKDRAGEGIREHHRQVLTNALQAIEAQSTDERVFNACTMTIAADRLNEAKELILKFRADMAKLMEKESGDETYQLGVQFFRLTEKL